MAAELSAVSEITSQGSAFLADASEGWDPIGHMIWDDATGEFHNLATTAGSYAPDVAMGVTDIVTDASKQQFEDIHWIADTIHDTGTSIDEGMRDIGLDPNTVKMAVGSIALTLTGQAWAIPLLNAAMVKAQGGSWEDMALAAATSYVASAAGAFVGDYVSSAVTGGTAVTAGQVAAQTGISAGSQQAAMIAAQNAAALGAGTTFTATALSNMAAAGVSNATAQLIRTGSVDLNKALAAATTSGITSGVSAVTSQLPGFSSLPASAQKTINMQVASALQGKDVDMDALGMALAGDMAMAAMKTYWKDGFAGIEQQYNAAAEKFNVLSKDTQPVLQEAKSVWDSYSTTQSALESKLTEVNSLIDTANANKDASLIPRIDTLKGEVNSLIVNRDSYAAQYQDLVKQYEAVQPDLESSLTSALTSRNDVFTYLAKSIDPEFDATAYAFLNPDAVKSLDASGTYGLGVSAAEAFLLNQSKDPNAVQQTSWREGFMAASDPTQFDAISTAYKKATGFDLTPELAKTDFSTYTAYQTGLANSTQDLLAQAAEAEKAGDETAYSQYMSKAFQQAANENLGWVQQDQTTGNYIWGNQIYDSTGALVGDYTAPEGTTPSLAQEDYQKYAQSLYGAMSPEQVAAAQDAAKVEGVKKALEGQGYTATTQAEAEQLAAAGDTFKEVTDPLAAYAKEHTVTSQDALDYLKQFNYQGFLKGLTPYIGQGAQYAQAKLQQDGLQKAMQYAMQQGTQFSPESYARQSSGSGAQAAGLAGLAGLLGLGMAGRTGGTTAETPQAQIQTRGVTPYSDTPAEAAGKVSMNQLLQQEVNLTPQEQGQEQQSTEFGDIQPQQQSSEDSMDYFRAGGIIPNANFGYSDQVQAMASGGIASLAPKHTGSDLGSYSDGGQLLRGPGTGLSDNIPATIERNQPARLASGEFVISADVVSALGGGSTEAGAKILYEMMDRIRQQAHGSKQQIKPVNPNKVLPK